MLLIGGTFDQLNGKPSYIIEYMGKELNCNIINGGNLNDLKIDFTKEKCIIWMPNIPNSEDKILPNIKKINPKLLLVSSKRVIEKDYKESDVVGRLLATKSNLGIMISKNQNYKFKVLDPLGNIYSNTESIPELCQSLNKRIEFLSNLTRIQSEKIEDTREFEINKDFLDIVQRYGTRFTNYVNAVNPNRFLGNASTRCSYGFPSIRNNDRIFVTRRNVDKTCIKNEDFVEVKLFDGKVGYYGDNKPSVDTPIQLKLFDYYQNVNYMIHGHVYVQDALFTTSKLPCGSVEEFEEIKKIFPDREGKNFTVNLLGHGFLVFSNNLGYFDEPLLIARPFPEGEKS